jgi:hypothetical protein
MRERKMGNNRPIRGHWDNLTLSEKYVAQKLFRLAKPNSVWALYPNAKQLKVQSYYVTQARDIIAYLQQVEFGLHNGVKE